MTNIVADTVSREAQFSWQGLTGAVLYKAAVTALASWELPPDIVAELANISENATFFISTGGRRRYALRIHRQNYHSKRAIECELAWLMSLQKEDLVATAHPAPGRDGAYVQSVQPDEVNETYFCVLFTYIDGVEPKAENDLTEAFHTLGALAATLHGHSRTWQLPLPFERLSWDLPQIIGEGAVWGNWRHGPGVDAPIRTLVARAEGYLSERLNRFGRGPEQFGLIHADMRLANILLRDDTVYIIDFDDCGFGWHLYDFAAAVSFMEHDLRLAALQYAWLEGYRTVAPLSEGETAEMDSFVMLRRLALLGWMGTHANVAEVRSLAAVYADGTAEMAERYLTTNKVSG